MGAVIVSDRIAEPFMKGTEMFAHGFTFGAHPVAAAIAMANLDIFEREDLNGHVLRARGRASGPRSRACATCRSSATCAAPATFRRSSW